jgi:cytochrome c-type biogenesis protein
MVDAEVTLAVAFLAGLVSFLSPCVLPIVPGFLAYLAGSSVQEAKTHRLTIFLNSVFFVLGFSLIFALLGVLLNTVLEAAAYEVQLWLAKLGGAIIIFFGLYLVGLIKIKFLEKEHKFNLKRQFKSKYLTSFSFGAAFAAGWTPCVGAVLGGLLGLAATQPGIAFYLLLTYSLGLGLPFLLVGLFVAQSVDFIHKYSHLLNIIKVVFGVILIIIGILAFTQNLDLVANFDFLNDLLLSNE